MTLSMLNGIPLSVRTYLLLTTPIDVLMRRWARMRVTYPPFGVREQDDA